MSSGEVQRQEEEEEFGSRVTLQGSAESTRAVINHVGPGLAPGPAIATGLIPRHLPGKGSFLGLGASLSPMRHRTAAETFMDGICRFLMGNAFPWKQNKVKHSPRSANNYCNKMCFY